ncbi:MAG TPA: glycosyltransferase [Anaerolineales bacterium]|jgi:glycosyltransferase involved in cell wall biosynthesis|nr:glycosyltransferase [Anaerolineales bacterium]
MRILIATQTYYPKTNGQAVFAVNLAEGLADKGHQVLVVMPSGRIRAHVTKKNGVEISAITAVPLIPFDANVHVTPRPGPQIRSILDEFQPEIVHVQDHYPLCRSVARAAGKRGFPLVGTNHFLPRNMIPFFPFLPKFPRGRQFLEKLLWKTVVITYNHLDAVTAPTETAAQILRHHGIRVPVHAITCGVDLNHFHPDPTVDRTKLLAKYGLDPERTIFLYVGRLDQDKGLDLLIESFHLLKRQDLQLGVAGHGHFFKSLQELVGEFNLGEKVIFTGYVPASDLPSLYNSVDFFAMPSEAELQSIATLEAMGTGRPVLAANARALPELVKDGVNGCLFKAGDPEDAARCISELVEECYSWAAMSAASLEIVRPHHIGHMLHDYLRLYDSVIQAAYSDAGPLHLFQGDTQA